MSEANAMFAKTEFKFSNFKSIESKSKYLCAKMRPSSTWSLIMSAVLHKYSWQETFGCRSGSAAAGS